MEGLSLEEKIGQMLVVGSPLRDCAIDSWEFNSINAGGSGSLGRSFHSIGETQSTLNPLVI